MTRTSLKAGIISPMVAVVVVEFKRRLIPMDVTTIITTTEAASAKRISTVSWTLLIDRDRSTYSRGNVFVLFSRLK